MEHLHIGKDQQSRRDGKKRKSRGQRKGGPYCDTPPFRAATPPTSNFEGPILGVAVGYPAVMESERDVNQLTNPIPTEALQRGNMSTNYGRWSKD